MFLFMTHIVKKNISNNKYYNLIAILSFNINEDASLNFVVKHIYVWIFLTRFHYISYQNFL